MPESVIATSLTEATVDQLVDELMRRKEVVCSIWNAEDVRSFVSESEAANDMDDEKVEEACAEVLSRAGRDLQDHLGSQGNFFLQMFWEREGDDILRSVSPEEPTV